MERMTMHPKASALLEAHAQHILAQFNPDQLATTLEREGQAVLDWLAARPINRLVSVERITSIAQNYVLGQALSAELQAEILSLIQHGIASPINQNTYIHQLIEHQHYSKIVETVASHEQLRNDIIHAVVTNPMYGKLLSEVIFHALSDYMVQNPLTKSVPGMSSLMKMGKGLVESAGSGAIKGYLQKNIQNLVGLSEKVIVNALDSKQIHQIAEYVWHEVKAEPLSKGTSYLKSGDVELAVSVGSDVWNHFRQTAYAQQMLSTLLAHWFSRNGEKSALTLLAELNISRETLLQEIIVSAQPVVAELLASGFFAERVRSQLEAFYSLESVSQLLD